MPFYKISEMETVFSELGRGRVQSVAGEFMKAGVVTYEKGDGPPPHFHPNEEQYVLVLQGRMRMVLGEEERTVERGDLIHIPRNTRHGIRILEGPAVFFTVKSPVGSGDLNQDYNQAKDADEVAQRLAGAKP